MADAGLASTTMSAAGVDIGDGVGLAVILMATCETGRHRRRRPWAVLAKPSRRPRVQFAPRGTLLGVEKGWVVGQLSLRPRGQSPGVTLYILSQAFPIS